MTKSKHPMQAALRKKMDKEVRSAVSTLSGSAPSDTIKASELLSTYPRKIQKKEAALLKSLKKNMAIKKIKRNAKHSKRTGPGLPTVEASPQVVYREGKRLARVAEKYQATHPKIPLKKS